MLQEELLHKLHRQCRVDGPTEGMARAYGKEIELGA